MIVYYEELKENTHSKKIVCQNWQTMSLTNKNPNAKFN